MRETIAKRIIEAARRGERDPDRLCRQALMPLGIDPMSMQFVSVGCDPPVSAYAAVTQST